MNKGIICIVGPTATGKTRLGIDLAEKLHTEVISADSVQVYKGLDIGSAKPTPEEMRSVKHHMIDAVEVDAPSFSVSAYKNLAFPVADMLLSSGKIPIVVGGSGLYINAFTSPLTFAVPSNAEVRAECEKEYEKSPEEFISMLRRIDSLTAEKLHRNDKKRLVRAMEVYRLTGKPISSFGSDFQNEQGKEPPYRSVKIGLNCDREILYQRINQRVDAMIDAGLVDEARSLFDKKYSRNLPAMLSIGYRQLFDYFDGICSLEDAIEAVKRETRRLAKRQMTWFKRDPDIHWIDCINNTPEQMAGIAMGIINTESEITL